MAEQDKESIEQTFDGLAEAANSFRSSLHNLRNSMRSREIDLYGGKGIGESQVQDYLSRPDLDKATTARELADLYRVSLHLSELVHELLENEPKKYQLKVNRDSEAHKVAERRRWSSWLHRSVRWLLGAILVFFVYSSAVSLSQYFDFFHVPVHDWFVSGGNP